MTSDDDQKRAASPTTSSGPARIGRFPILKRVGRGGMGEVYLGFDEVLKRQVAIKILPRRMAADPSWIERFEREATAVSALEHPYIVPIYELGQDEDLHYFVMRFVDGDPLNLFVKKLHWSDQSENPAAGTQPAAEDESGDTSFDATVDQPPTVTPGSPPSDDPHARTVTSASVRKQREENAAAAHPRTPGLSSERTAENSARVGTHSIRFDPSGAASDEDVGTIIALIEKCAEALDFAHRHGILHRDIKPSNIMVDNEGNPQLLDFGLVKVTGTVDVHSDLSREGNIIGTLPYISPEVFAGDQERIDHRADIYALGITLYECLCGTRPFHADTAQDLMFNIISKEPPKPSSLRNGISRDLETVVSKAIEKNPEHRYQTGADLARDLENLRLLREIEARPVTRAVKLARWANAHPILAFMTVVALIAAIVLPTILTVGFLRDRAERARVDEYTKHVREAERLDQERMTLKSRLSNARKELAKLERETKKHLSADSDAKRRLFKQRHDIARMEKKLADYGARIEFQLQRSREAVDPHAPDDSERVALYAKLYAEAEAAGNVERMATYRVFLESAGREDLLVGRGGVRFQCSVEGARVVIYPCQESSAGRIEADLSRGEELGRTPIPEFQRDTGLWLLEISAPAHKTIRYPVLIERDSTWGAPGWQDGRFDDKDWTVRLPKADAFKDEDWAYVPRGPFLATGPGYVGLEPRLGLEMDWQWCDAFVMAREEVRLAHYMEFLETPATITLLQERYNAPGDDGKPSFKLTLMPRYVEFSQPMMSMNDKGGYVFPQQDDFDIENAVTGVSKPDAEDFIAWLEETEGVRTRLPRNAEWQKAARGVDGRLFSWGNTFDWSFASSREAFPRPAPQAFPVAPRTFPMDRSVYGIYDLTGNASEWLADGPPSEVELNQFYWFAGGAFAYGSPYMYAAWPWNAVPWDYVSVTLGFRLVKVLD